MKEGVLRENHVPRLVNALLVVFCLGIFLAASVPLPLWTMIGILACGLLCTACGFYWKIDYGACGLLVLFFAAGMVRLLHDAALPPDDIGFMAGKNLTVEGYVLEGPRVREKENNMVSIKYVIEVQRVKQKGEFVSAEGRIIIYAKEKAAAPVARIGDNVSASGEIRTIHGYGNPGLIDSEAALKRKGITAKMFAAKNTLRVTSLPSWRISRQVEQLRARLLAAMESVMPKEDAAAIFAMLLGGYGGLKPELLEAFTATGIVHILSVSGSHIALLAACLAKAARLLNVKTWWAAIVVIAAILLYGMFAGFVPPVVRSCIMGILTFAATSLGREKDARHILSLTGLIMLMLDPRLLFDISFQLSFGATAGLLYLPHLLQEYLVFLPRWIAENLALTTAAQISVLPFLAWYFNDLSVSSLAANLLVVPVVEFIIIVGLLGALIGLFLPFAQDILFVFCSLALGVVYHATRAIAQIPGGNVYLPSGGIWAGLLYYAMIFLWVEKTARIRDFFTRFIWRKYSTGIFIAVFFLFFSWRINATNIVTVHFIDVGQGDAALIVTSSGKAVLIDTGGSLQSQGGFDVGERVVVPYLKHYGVREVAYLILTHAHEDHAGGAAAVRRKMKVEHMLIGREDRQMYAKVFRTSVERLPENCIPAYAGQEFYVDDVCFTVAAARDGRNRRAGNEVSSVIKATHGKNSFLFTGDLDAEGEKEIVESGVNVASTVLKVAHHGAKTSSTAEFLARVKPAYAVISVGADNSFGHPNRDVLSRLAASGAKIYRTDESGAVVFSSDGETLAAESFRKNG